MLPISYHIMTFNNILNNIFDYTKTFLSESSQVDSYALNEERLKKYNQRHILNYTCNTSANLKNNEIVYPLYSDFWVNHFDDNTITNIHNYLHLYALDSLVEISYSATGDMCRILAAFHSKYDLEDFVKEIKSNGIKIKEDVL